MEDGWRKIGYDNSTGTSPVYCNNFIKVGNIVNLKPDTDYTFYIETRNFKGTKTTDLILYIGNTITLENSKTVFTTGIKINDFLPKYAFNTTTRADFQNINLDLRNFLIVPVGQNVSVEYRMMIIEGKYTLEQIESYEPYTGGIASPNPDYPQEIKTITDSLSLTSCNKNLVNEILNTTIRNGITLTSNGDGTYIANGTATSDTTFNIKEGFSFKKGETYTLNGVEGGSSTTYYIFCYYIADLYNGSKTVTITQDLKNISLGIVIKKGYTANNLLFKPMLVKGSKVEPFEKHIQSQITANLPEGEFIGKLDDTDKDTLEVSYNENDGKYHLILNKNIKKITLNGTESS